MMYFSVFSRCTTGRRLTVQLALLFSLILLASSGLSAEQPSYTTIKTARFTLHIDRSTPLTKKQINAEQISASALKILNETHTELSRIFKVTPQKEVVLRFLSPKEFKRQTGAPSWTSAMFFRNEITIPLNSSGIDPKELERALRHEYVHAVIAEISNYRGPAWLDEGVAQIIEGEPNPLLGPALKNWLIHNDPIPLNWLHGGFTTLKAEIVPAAYAQSLFASRLLLRRYGFSAITEYFQLLATGYPEFKAFKSAFGISKRNFEASLKKQLLAWLHSGAEHP